MLSLRSTKSYFEKALDTICPMYSTLARLTQLQSDSSSFVKVSTTNHQPTKSPIQNNLFHPLTASLAQPPEISTDKDLKRTKDLLKLMGYQDEEINELTEEWLKSSPARHFHYVYEGLKNLSDKFNWSWKELDPIIKVVRDNNLNMFEIYRLVINSKRDKIFKTPEEFKNLIAKNYQDYGIEFFGRYTIDLLRDNIAETFYGSVALAMLAKTDHNDALYFDKDTILSIKKHKYHTVIFELDNDSDFINTILKTSRMYGKISLVYISGHGSPESTAFGDDYENGDLDTSDFESLPEETIDELHAAFASDARAILFSCQTGKGGPTSDNLAKILKDALGVDYLFACESNCSMDHIVWDKSNKILNVKWYESNPTSDTGLVFSRYDESLKKINDDLRRWTTQNIIAPKSYGTKGADITEKLLFVENIFPSVVSFSDIIMAEPLDTRPTIFSKIKTLISKGNTRPSIISAIRGNGGQYDFDFDRSRHIQYFAGQLQNLFGYSSLSARRLAGEYIWAYEYAYTMLYNNDKSKAATFVALMIKSNRSDTVIKGLLQQKFGKSISEIDYISERLLMINSNFRNEARKGVVSKWQNKEDLKTMDDTLDTFVDDHPSSLAFVGEFDKIPQAKKKSVALLVLKMVDEGKSKSEIASTLQRYIQ
ncbi:hypothetical protein KKA47_03055 [bacterium]|nr:hypothetical protein [bacterium]